MRPVGAPYVTLVNRQHTLYWLARLSEFMRKGGVTVNYGLYGFAKPYAFGKFAKAPWLYGFGKMGKLGKFGKYPFGVW